MKLLTYESLHINPFFRDITDSDMEDAGDETNTIVSDKEIDENIVFTSFTVILYKKDIITKFLLG